MEKVRIDDLRVDETYQRDIRETWEKQLSRNFDPMLLGVITVSKRKDGSLYVIDGNHRRIAAKENGMEYILADVREGLSLEKEAELFYKLNTGQRKTNYNENLHALIASDNEEALRYKQCLDHSGIKYSLKSSDYGSHAMFVAHNAGVNVMKKYGCDVLIRALEIIKESKTRPDNRVLIGLSKVLTYPGVSDERVKSTLMKTPVEFLFRTMASFSVGEPGGGRDRENAMAKSIASYYNKGLRTNRIDLSFFDRKRGTNERKDNV